MLKLKNLNKVIMKLLVLICLLKLLNKNSFKIWKFFR